MIFGETDVQRIQRRFRVSKYRFAWYPLRLYDGRWAFLEDVFCKMHFPKVESVSPYYHYFQVGSDEEQNYRKSRIV